MVSSSTVARWLKLLLEASGIDISMFSTHSVRGASSSAAASAGISISDILKAAGWSSESTFQWFYYRSTENPSFGRAVSSQYSQQATNNTVDMWNWAFWIMIHKWLRPRSSCQLFGIIWRRWSQTYHRSNPPFPEETVIANQRLKWVVRLWVLFLPGELSFLLWIADHLRELAKHHWYAWLHCFHIFPNSWQPLCGLSHYEFQIPFYSSPESSSGFITSP